MAPQTTFLDLFQQVPVLSGEKRLRTRNSPRSNDPRVDLTHLDAFTLVSSSLEPTRQKTNSDPRVE